jgi:DNA-binding CsgD family transcriptional regulator
MAKTNKNPAAKARKLDAQQQALELRRAGHGYQAIADRLGCSLSTAHGYIKEAMAEAKAQIDTDASELKAEEISRLDGMLVGLWDAAKMGDYAAVDRVLKIMERRSKLLGLDAPVKVGLGGDKDAPPIGHKHDIQTFSDAELERIIASGLSSA